MEATALEARFEQFSINDQNEDPAGQTSYHKSKVSDSSSWKQMSTNVLISYRAHCRQLSQ
jgi:hypothetical protein